MALAFLTPGVIFLAVLILVILGIIALTLVERKLNKKVTVIREEKETHYPRKIGIAETLKRDPQKFLFALDDLARDFFSEEYEVDRNLRYSSLIGIFEKRGNDKIVEFCKNMQMAFYAGEKLDSSKLDSLLRNLKTILGEKARAKEGDVDLKSIVMKSEKEGREKKPVDVYILGKGGKIEREKMEDQGKKVGFIQKMSMRQKKKQEEQSMLKNKRDQDRQRRERYIAMQKEQRKKFIEANKGAIEIKKARRIEVVPYRREEIKYKKTKYPVGERGQRRIRSIDDLDRVRNKIKKRVKLLPYKGLVEI
jgi:hypothetical protein